MIRPGGAQRTQNQGATAVALSSRFDEKEKEKKKKKKKKKIQFFSQAQTFPRILPVRIFKLSLESFLEKFVQINLQPAARRMNRDLNEDCTMIRDTRVQKLEEKKSAVDDWPVSERMTKCRFN